ncbi:MAG: hypothetical protein IJT38_05685 [Clostridia bacterium]|nr:hypothetical protein [Clostridia bacterium]
MIKTKTGDYTALYAENGFLLTNGETFGTRVYLAEGADEDEWYETPALDAGEGEYDYTEVTERGFADGLEEEEGYDEF